MDRVLFIIFGLAAAFYVFDVAGELRRHRYMRDFDRWTRQALQNVETPLEDRPDWDKRA